MNVISFKSPAYHGRGRSPSENRNGRPVGDWLCPLLLSMIQQIGHAVRGASRQDIADRTRGARSNASLADRHNPRSIGRFGPMCCLCVRQIVPRVGRAVYAPIPRLVNGRSGATSPVLSPFSPLSFGGAVLVSYTGAPGHCSPLLRANRRRWAHHFRFPSSWQRCYTHHRAIIATIGAANAYQPRRQQRGVHPEPHPAA